ncbi:hypothetical protein AB0O01_27465 [Streptomyces sp. NPDC093252]|uniref:hypothetical protein n=1 Tax=Streptomyces sp. NPDC093252 TaxID=3154980 RepID=UPI0034263C06
MTARPVEPQGRAYGFDADPGHERAEQGEDALVGSSPAAEVVGDAEPVLAQLPPQPGRQPPAPPYPGHMQGVVPRVGGYMPGVRGFEERGDGEGEIFLGGLAEAHREGRWRSVTEARRARR